MFEFETLSLRDKMNDRIQIYWKLSRIAFKSNK